LWRTLYATIEYRDTSYYINIIQLYTLGKSFPAESTHFTIPLIENIEAILYYIILKSKELNLIYLPLNATNAGISIFTSSAPLVIPPGVRRYSQNDIGNSRDNSPLLLNNL
jgi:hypothetical protein